MFYYLQLFAIEHIGMLRSVKHEENFIILRPGFFSKSRFKEVIKHHWQIWQ